jgi:hypothetical protein
MLIKYAGYWPSLLVLFVLVLILLPPAVIYLNSELGKSKEVVPITLAEIFKTDKSVGSLSLARLFLFCIPRCLV